MKKKYVKDIGFYCDFFVAKQLQVWGSYLNTLVLFLLFTK